MGIPPWMSRNTKITATPTSPSISTACSAWYGMVSPPSWSTRWIRSYWRARRSLKSGTVWKPQGQLRRTSWQVSTCSTSQAECSSLKLQGPLKEYLSVSVGPNSARCSAYKRRRVFTLQGHPEFDTEVDLEIQKTDFWERGKRLLGLRDWKFPSAIPSVIFLTPNRLLHSRIRMEAGGV